MRFLPPVGLNTLPVFRLQVKWARLARSLSNPNRNHSSQSFAFAHVLPCQPSLSFAHARSLPLSPAVGVVSPSISVSQCRVSVCWVGSLGVCEFGLQVAFGFGLGVLASSTLSLSLCLSFQISLVLFLDTFLFPTHLMHSLSVVVTNMVCSLIVFISQISLVKNYFTLPPLFLYIYLTLSHSSFLSLPLPGSSTNHKTG